MYIFKKHILILNTQLKQKTSERRDFLYSQENQETVGGFYETYEGNKLKWVMVHVRNVFSSLNITSDFFNKNFLKFYNLTSYY